MIESREPLISVIVPVYNGQCYLAGCIESIEHQTYKNLEIIIVNDGSTDSTGALCDHMQAVYDNVRVLKLEDRGVSAARNAGMEAAEGEFITFVDADDRILPDMIRRLYDCLVKTDSDVAGCRFFLWRSEEEWQRTTGATSAAAVEKATRRLEVQKADELGKDVLRADKPETQIKIYNADSYLREELLRGNSRCWSKLYRRAVTEKVRFRENITIGEDLLFLVQMLPHVNAIAELPYAGYGYYQNPAGTIQRKFTPRYMDQITCWQLAREEILRMDERLDAQVTALWMTGIMLTAGKIAMLPREEWDECQEYIRVCWESLKKAMKIHGAYGRLSMGYRVKTMMFRLFPQLYLLLYHMHKHAD